MAIKQKSCEAAAESIYDTKAYRRSRKAYAGQCTFEYFVSILVTDAFLAKLLTSMGISDAMIGIISSFISFAFLFQLCTVFLAQRIKNIKRTSIIFNTLSQLFFMGLFLIPFLPLGLKSRTASVTVFILAAYFCNYLVASVIYKWGNSFVDPCRRGSYSANKEIISLASGMIFTLIVGYILDRFEALDNLEGGFLFVAVAIFILSACNFICLLMIKKDTSSAESNDSHPFGEVLKNTIGNRNFSTVIVMTIIWNIAQYMTIGFLGVYKTKELLMSVGLVQVVNIVASIFRMLMTRLFGTYSDKHSFAAGFRLALCFAAAAFAVNMFTTPGTWWLIILYTVLYYVSLAGTNANSFNITYSYVKSEYFVQASAIKNSIGGVCGFLASILGGKILAYVQANNNTVLGLHIYGQQLLSAISFALVVLEIFFVHFVVEKQEAMRQ